MSHKPQVGQSYGYYTVIDETIQISKDHKRMFHVKCSCGTEEYKKATRLVYGRTSSCKSCAAKRTAAHHPPPMNFKGVGGLSMTHFSAIKHGALRRDIPFNLEIEDAWDLFLQQQGNCALSGVPIVLEVAIKGCNVNWDIITASLDRKDSKLGYEINNVWWVHKEMNRLKNKYSLDELLFWSQKLISVHGNPEPSLVKDMEVAKKVQRLTGEESNQ